ncbi:MAG: hypothetical protein AAGF74_13650 [Pseudomonadota bacterium]
MNAPSHLPHPDFAGKAPPRSAAFGPFRLEILSPKDVQEDFEVVVGSAGVLQGLFGNPWPSGLTLEENMEDLERHEREFLNDQAFAWIIRSEAGRYLGCAYLKPDREAPGTAKVFTWIRNDPDRALQVATFNTAFLEWVRPHLPVGYALSVTSNGAGFPGD